MGYISFDKNQLVNLEYSLQRELIRTSRSGAYASSTIINCNTRKYHGLLVCPMEDIDNDNHVLLSTLDVSVIQHDEVFNLGVHKYPDGVYFPKGHKYLRDFQIETIPYFIYRVGGVLLKMERILSDDDRIMLKYTLLEAHSATKLRFQPFLAFRNVHKLSKANFFVNTKYTSVENGIKLRMYDAYKYLYMQISKKCSYVHAPDWYYNIEYIEEQKRGYDYREDLYVPGFFEVDIKAGESVIFTAALSEITPSAITRKFNTELSKRTPRNNYEDCLRSAAQQFICKRNGKTEIVAGYPWFGRWGRDTFISLPGLTLHAGNAKACREVLDTMTSEMKNGLFPNIGAGDDAALNSVDAPLWFFWALQEYSNTLPDKSQIWQQYGKKMKAVLNAYRKGTSFNIKMNDEGLVFQGCGGKALTWMDAVVNGIPVTQRYGFAVEINALWYNAVMFSLELAEASNDTDFVNEWKDIPEKTKAAFLKYFWNDKRGYLADCYNGNTNDPNAFDWKIRPNQIFACSLPYSMLTTEMCASVLNIVKRELLTSKGLRTLAPESTQLYKGVYQGNQEQRDSAYHQGVVWPWLLGHFCEAALKVYGKQALPLVKKIAHSFEEDMTIAGIGSISEIYDGDPPYTPRGAIAQAWSVAEILRIFAMIRKFENTK
ncbi:MAG: glycogen debranching enzyme N-terminal domain-containing protein [Bacteroidales bacterium]|nr:glycogen debranching enzyme N-terminal domain-containing protein [Bacteroidales bacterium]